MTYSCTDFTDDILGTLGIDVPEEDEDDPSAQADLAMAEITRLQTLATDARAVLNSLLDWAEQTGGWDAQCWKVAKKFRERLLPKADPEPSNESDGKEPRFRNFYKCERCGNEWDDTWTATCEDDCPKCGARHMTPYKSEDA